MDQFTQLKLHQCLEFFQVYMKCCQDHLILRDCGQDPCLAYFDDQGQFPCFEDKEVVLFGSICR